ncbi:rod shape-determining protein MreC [Cyclobacterium marinum]|uniref:Cell shape-determining protein MreC n=1 Tax=Cyclobacterium marinum (strain ATCC 25205 / DSM 745 / LMG 13164 / NCIMB 1802) TaxID=880070 RepID=G0J6V4_CYCMS|nr:rod shape-determining protein MreC [Cyclobacterium marinum]AEL26152.1 rod shape-determining protein MreC [Cyclobacterium marinum DSM 745]MBI0399509.1 rod shape-determining protein MreC [Cyclobacterium marinum]MBR9776946.1 rod shape-determining protein MreC [Cytophagales bacterium]|tara:strand:- start:13200 stop:14033 length:834 start_codon:yes stop_codon:yes gene_type:complete
MQQIFLFLYRLRAFILFLILELLALGIIFTHNSPQGAVYFNSSNKFTGRLLSSKNNFVSYFTLNSTNKALAEKNASLLNRLDRMTTIRDSAHFTLDSSFSNNFNFWSARVINNSINLSQNYITLNKGSLDGVEEGMGVFNEQGIVGRVKGTSSHFSSVISVLHTDLLISSKIKNLEVFGSTKWDGLNSNEAKLLYVPRHVMVEPGQEIVTSGYNAVFPEGLPIGKVKEVSQGSETNYLDITISLGADFSKLNFVYLVKNDLREEIDSLEMEMVTPNQ